ncbi:MAG: lauroyl acyltransferase [Fibrobacter sp.]|nr:lauroyl acyltransferase [Fibrobacter sp.]
MFRLKVFTYRLLFNILLHLPDIFYSFLFTLFFPIYKALHTERAYGRTVRHLDAAREYMDKEAPERAEPMRKVSARDVFKGIYWNALDSYRGLARIKSVERRIVFENEDIIKNAVAECAKIGMPIAGISIHQGSFELMHRILCRYGEHVQLITDSVGDAAFREVLRELRSDPRLTEFHPEETGKLIRELFRTKGILAMVYDQGKHTKGNAISLFGRPSTLYLRLPQKINQMGAGIVTFRTWTENTPERRIVIRFESYYPPHYDKQGRDLVEDIARETERWIAEHPAQWSWNYHGNFVV